MNIEIKRKDQLTATEQQALHALTKAVYPPKPQSESPKPHIRWSESIWSVLVWDEQAELVSYVGMLTRMGMLDGKPILLGGVGNVKTHPNARGKGYAGAALAQAVEALREQHQVAFSLLTFGAS